MGERYYGLFSGESIGYMGGGVWVLLPHAPFGGGEVEEGGGGVLPL